MFTPCKYEKWQWPNCTGSHYWEAIFLSHLRSVIIIYLSFLLLITGKSASFTVKWFFSHSHSMLKDGMLKDVPYARNTESECKVQTWYQWSHQYLHENNYCLDSSRHVKILRKTTNFLSLKDNGFDRTSVILSWMNDYKASWIISRQKC